MFCAIKTGKIAHLVCLNNRKTRETLDRIGILRDTENVKHLAKKREKC